MGKGGDSRPQEASIQAEACASECRCRDADARTLIWLQGTDERTNELAWCMVVECKRRRGKIGARKKERDSRIRLVDKTGGSTWREKERADLAQVRRKKKSLARTPRHATRR